MKGERRKDSQDPVTKGAGQQDPPQPKNNKKRNLIIVLLLLFIFVIPIIPALLFVPIYMFVAQPFEISGEAMLPRYKGNQIYLINKILYKVAPPVKDDVIVFKLPPNQQRNSIKRIIGVPGDTISIQNGEVYRNNQPLLESYLERDVLTYGGEFLPEGEEISIPKNSYLVLGDNRLRSADSREYGLIRKSEIVGKVWFCLSNCGDNSENQEEEVSHKPIIPKGWKTYTNYKERYQISIPQEWYVTAFTTDPISNLLCFENPPEAQSINISSVQPSDCRDFNKQKIDMSFGEFGGYQENLETLYSFAKLKPFKIGTISGEKAVYYLNGSSVSIIFNFGGATYDFNMPTDGKRTYDSKLDTILSTMTFLTPQEIRALPTPTPTPTVFLKRYYKAEDKIVGYRQYPGEIKDLTDEQLVGINCSERAGGGFTKISKKEISSKPLVAKIMQLASGQTDAEEIIAVSTCQLEDGRMLYALYKQDAERKNLRVEFGFEENDALSKKASYNPGTVVGSPAIGFGPLELTKNNTFYYLLDVGDSISVVEVHKLDLNNGIHTIILKCRGDYEVVDGRDVQKPSCE